MKQLNFNMMDNSTKNKIKAYSLVASAIAVGAIGAVVPIVIVLEFKLVEQPLSARTR